MSLALLPSGNMATSPKTRPKRANPYGQAVQLQKLIIADAQNPDLKPLVRAGIARAFCELEECKRKLRMRPLPKAIDVSDKRKLRKPPSSTGIVSEAP